MVPAVLVSVAEASVADARVLKSLVDGDLRGLNASLLEPGQLC